MDRQPPTLSEMLDNLFGIKSSHRINNLVNEVGVTTTKIMQGNPRRVGIVLVNLSVNNLYVAPDNQVSATRGIWLAPNGGSMTLVWDKDMELICMPWFAIASAAASSIFLIEYISA